jgi:poly-gamma-glutamate capsule biosynthesis protein CapA/YwtB (metallophosphatase superfamily)
MKDKNFLLTLPFLFFASYLFWGVPAYNSSLKQFPKDTLQVAKDSLVTIQLTFVGDLMCHSSQYKYVKDSKSTYNFTPVYEYVQPYLQKADLTIGNLETVLAGATTSFSGYPAFNTPNAYADALKNIGFDYLFTANNHSYDQGEKGVLRTLEELSQRNLVSIGTHCNEKDRDSIRIATVKGIRIAFLGYTEFSNIPVPAAKKYLVNPIDTALIRKNVATARQQGADLVVINYHWGKEYKQPTDFQQMIAEWTWGIGVDIIIGEHPHVLQPVQWFTQRSTARLDTGLVAYSLGNFYSSQQWRYSDAGVMLSIGIEKNLATQRLRINKVSAVPTWVFKGTLQGEKQPKFLIFPSEMALQAKDTTLIKQNLLPNTLQQLNKAQLAKMEQAFEDSKKVLNNYGAKVSMDSWK